MICVLHSAKDDRIYFKQARSLSAAGHELSIVHGSPDGLLHDMQGELLPEGKDEYGITHLVIPDPTSLLDKIGKKLFRGSFYKAFVEKATATDAEIYVAHEAQSIYIARLCAEAASGTYVFDSHESLYLHSPKAKYAIKTEMPRIPYYTTANRLTQEAIAKLNPTAKSEVIYNASPIASSPVADHSGLLIVHEGSLPFNRGLELMMEGLSFLKKTIPDFRYRIVGEVKGDEKNYFDKMITEHGLQENITVTGWQPYEALASHLSEASIGLILNTSTPNNLYAGPANKLFNYMACNICVVAVDLPETTRILKETGAGVTLAHREPQLLADTLVQLIKDKDLLARYRNAAHSAHIKRSWAEESKKLVTFYNGIE